MTLSIYNIMRYLLKKKHEFKIYSSDTVDDGYSKMFEMYEFESYFLNLCISTA